MTCTYKKFDLTTEEVLEHIELLYSKTTFMTLIEGLPAKVRVVVVDLLERSAQVAVVA